MSIIPINRVEHVDKGWIPPKNLAFAKSISMVPVGVPEFSRLAMGVPILLVKVKEEFYFVAVMGLETNKNLLVTHDGSWLGNYIPAVFRSSPFSLMLDEEGNSVLCLDDSLTKIVANEDGERFFDDNGQLSKKLAETMDFLKQKHQNKIISDNICKKLKEFGLIKPAQIKLKISGHEKMIGGFFSVDEKALNETSDANFLELRKCGALPACYMHLLSQMNWKILISLHEGKAVSERAMQDLGSQIFSLDTSDELNFDV